MITSLIDMFAFCVIFFFFLSLLLFCVSLLSTKRVTIRATPVLPPFLIEYYLDESRILYPLIRARKVCPRVRTL